MRRRPLGLSQRAVVVVIVLCAVAFGWWLYTWGYVAGGVFGLVVPYALVVYAVGQTVGWW